MATWNSAPLERDSDPPEDDQPCGYPAWGHRRSCREAGGADRLEER